MGHAPHTLLGTTERRHEGSQRLGLRPCASLKCVSHSPGEGAWVSTPLFSGVSGQHGQPVYYTISAVSRRGVQSVWAAMLCHCGTRPLAIIQNRLDESPKMCLTNKLYSSCTQTELKSQPSEIESRSPVRKPQINHVLILKVH